LIRGKHISRPIEEIVEEAKQMIEQGVKEIILIAQDTTYYGLDLYGKRRLYDLLVELCKLDVHWIRLQYAYPNEFPLDVLDLMNKEKKLCHYVDMPLQHINDRILSSMKRNITSKEIKDLIHTIRQKVNDIAFRTTLIVGYPTETKQEFNELVAFVKEEKFERMGAFTYSKEEGTMAATLDDNVSEKEKQRRLDYLTQIQQEISFDINQNKIGKVLEVVIDRKEEEYYVGRTQYDSPEVDNEVLIKDTQKLVIGNFYNVLITSAVEFDLYGQVNN
jgi:ribosomal protein S12 methylthiotransferase